MKNTMLVRMGYRAFWRFKREPNTNVRIGDLVRLWVGDNSVTEVVEGLDKTSVYVSSGHFVFILPSTKATA